MNKKTKIAFILPTLGAGGAEKICRVVANKINSDKFDISILCLKSVGENLELLKPHIRVIDVKSPSVHYSILKIYKITKELKPDIIVGWMGYLNAYLSFFIPFFPKNIKWICRESSIPSLMNKHLRLTSLFNFYYRFYNRYDKIICQSNYMADDLIRSYHVKKEKIIIINNPLHSIISKEVPVVDKREKGYQLLFVGGLRKVKRVELLIKTLQLLPKNYFLTIVGNGEEESNIRKCIAQYNLSDRVEIVNHCYNPYPYYRTSHVLLLSSLFEGLPNVIIESFSCGCPVIGFNIKGGANEILSNYGGFVVESDSINDFANKIIDVCENTKIDHERIIDFCKQKYNTGNIIQQYENVFVLENS